MEKVVSKAHRDYRRYMIIGAGLVAFGSGFVWLYRSGWWDTIPTLIRASGVYGVLLSFSLIVLQTVFPFAPFAVLAGFNATVHGFWIGYLATLAGAFASAVLLYYLSRYAMKRHFRSRLDRFLARHGRLCAMEQKVSHARGWSAFLVILALRLQPWLPSSIIDILAGLAGVSWLPFIVATLLGQAPMVALESYVGHRVLNLQTHQREVWLIAGAGVVFLLGFVLFRRMRSIRKRKTKAGLRADNLP